MLTKGVPDTEIIDAPLGEEAAAIQKAAGLLRAGEVVAVPTETVYGLAADAFDPDAVAQIFEVKERPTLDPLIVHIGTKSDLPSVADVPENVQSVIDALTSEFWPGPLTIVLPKAPEVPDLVTSGLETVAVRMPDHPVMRALCKEVGPLAAPSANIFGRISPTSASAVEQELGGRIPLIVDGGACNAGLESTIIHVTAGEKRPQIQLLRAGPVTKEELQKFGKVIKEGRVTDTKLAAPGQLPSHYAPRVQLEIVKDIHEYEFDPDLKYALLAYKGNPKEGYVEAHDWHEVEVLTPGKGKLAEAAVRLFFAMRQLDNSGADKIIAEPVAETGIGVAIMDRLRRAAADKE